jgi:hypothetical protein
MATLEELYRYYLNQPITYVPGSTIGGLSSLTEINRNDSGGDSSESSNTVSVNSTPGKGITSVSYSDMAKALGFAMNPALGIANMVATEAFGKSPMSMAMDALGFGDSSSTGTANATDTGDMGSEAANNAATDAANASVGAGDGSSSDGGSTGSCGSFKKGGYITGASVRPNLNIGGRVGYAEGGISQEGVIPGFEKIRDTVYFNPDGTPNLEKIKAANFLPGSSINEFGYRDIKTGDTYGQSTYADIASGRYPRIFDPSKYTIGPDNNYYEVDSIITDGGLRYRINADGSRTLLDTTIAQTTPTEDFSDYLNTTTINTNVQTAPTVAEQMISPEDALTPEIPSNNVLDQWKAHAEATQAMKGETGLDAIPEYGFQTGYDFQSKFPNLDPRIGAGLASGYQVLTEGLGMFNPNNPNFLNPAAAYKTALSDATKNIEGIMAFDQNLMTPEQQENRNKYLKSVGQNIPQTLFPQGDFLNIRERPLESAFERFTGAAGPLAENINTAIGSLNPFQKQQYMNYAVQNPEQAIAAAQQNKDFLAATQKNIAPATTPAPASMAAGGRVFYLQGGLASLLR